MSTVVVVGATQGTGRALAAEYARRGADVFITGRTQERATTVAANSQRRRAVGSQGLRSTSVGRPTSLPRSNRCATSTGWSWSEWSAT